MIVDNRDSTTSTLSPESAKMGDLEDLNRTLYDIGAQDLLDVWDAMETEVGNKM